MSNAKELAVVPEVDVVHAPDELDEKHADGVGAIQEEDAESAEDLLALLDTFGRGEMTTKKSKRLP